VASVASLAYIRFATHRKRERERERERVREGGRRATGTHSRVIQHVAFRTYVLGERFAGEFFCGYLLFE
jgi:hypothetical protein